jgi:hypothetical protein
VWGASFDDDADVLRVLKLLGSTKHSREDPTLPQSCASNFRPMCSERPEHGDPTHVRGCLVCDGVSREHSPQQSSQWLARKFEAFVHVNLRR